MSSWVPCGKFSFSKLSSRFLGTKTKPKQDDNQSKKESNLCQSIGVDIPCESSLDCISSTGIAKDLKRFEEGINNYKIGGYHPVVIGEIYNDRYTVVQKLGWGHFSTVWLVNSISPAGLIGQFAMKVQRSGSAYSEAAADEIQLLGKSSGVGSNREYVVHLHDHFQMVGPNGIHFCMVFEVLGDNLLSLLRYHSKITHSQNVERYGKGVPLHLVKEIVSNIALGLVHLHDECNIIHTDLKPENVLLLSQVGCSVNMERCVSHPVCKIADLGNACWEQKHFTDYITTRQYRSPEAILEFPYDKSVDIWSLACITFELVTGEYLFDPKADKNGCYSRDEDHLALFMEILGPECVPHILLSQGKSSMKYFGSDGNLKNIKDLLHWPLIDLLKDKYSMHAKVASELSSFLKPMLDMNPRTRARASDCLKHSWLSGQNSNSEGLLNNSAVANMIHRNNAFSNKRKNPQ